METFLILGALTALGIALIFIRIGLRRVLRFGAGVDVAISIGLLVFFAGTFSGLMTAAVAGIGVTAFLLLARLFVRPKKNGAH